MRHLRRSLLRGLALVAVPTVLSALGAGPASAADRISLESLTVHGDSVHAVVTYRCDSLSGVDSIRVGLTDRAVGGVFSGVMDATCDNKNRTAIVKAPRQAGPQLAEGAECVVAASLGTVTFGQFTATTTHNFTRTLR